MGANAVIHSKAGCDRETNANSRRSVCNGGSNGTRDMLSLLLVLSVAGEPPKIVTLPKRARPAITVRKRTERKAVGRTLPQPAKFCLTGTCTQSAAPGYRLTGVTGTQRSGKMEVVKSAGMPCGVQGAPVCPRKGQELLHTRID